MSEEIFESMVDDIFSDIQEYGEVEWVEDIGEGDFEYVEQVGENYLSLTIDGEGKDFYDVLDLGRYLDAKAISEKNKGESYEITFQVNL